MYQTGQVCLFDTKGRCMPCIHEETLSDLARVPDMNMHLECNEIIQDWDLVEGYEGFDSLKNESMSNLKSRYLPVTDDLQMYDDVPPPNSPISNQEADKGNLLFFHNEYVNRLLNVWRESSEYNVSAESTQVDLDQFQQSDRWSFQPEQGYTASQSSTSSGNRSQDSDDVSMEDSNHGSSPEHNTSLGHSSDQEFVEASLRTFSVTRSDISSRSNSPLNVNTPGPYDHLRSVSPRIMRSPSPVFPGQGLLRTPSPNWDELQANLSDITPQELLLFARDRYSVRSRSPQSVSDQEVPDIDMDEQSFYSDWDEYTVRRSRIPQSCQDQVVPEFIEE